MDEQDFRTDIDSVTRSEWAGLIEKFEDASLYQTWSYGAVRWGEGSLSHLALRKAGEPVAAAQVRLIRAPFFKCGIAYVRWGPLCQLRGQKLEPEIVRRAMAELHAEYVVKRGLYLRIVPSAFFGTERAGALKRAFADFANRNPGSYPVDRTLVLDLSSPLDELRKRLDQKWRNQLNRAEKNSLTIVEGKGADQYGKFLALYQEMWNRKRFETTVDAEEFGRICEDLPEPLKMKTLICYHQGVAVSAIVCSAIGDTGIYLLGATTGSGLQTKAAYLLQWTVIKWLKENGFRYYDLGGIDPERNPGVYHFKSGLSGQDVVRLAPLQSCESRLSSLCMRLADLGQKGVRTVIKDWRNKAPALAPGSPAAT